MSFYILHKNICRIFLVFTLLFGSSNLNATHIIGGDFDVEWIGGNNFRVSLKLFRDCLNGQAAFDNSVTITVYDNVTNDELPALGFNMNLIEEEEIPLGDECYSPTGLCVEQGSYQNNIVLPDNPNGYYLAWERCCRNAIIENILLPGEKGMVFYVQVPDPSLQNSSPTFGNYPTDGYLCINYENTIDFGVTDADGDELVFSLVTPLAGDESMGSNPNPQHAGPKPYTPVDWKDPYSLDNVVGGTPPMSIDPETGIITAMPDRVGVFVFAILVEEYRDGQKIGEVRREIQYQALTCDINLVPEFSSLNPSFSVVAGETVSITFDVEDDNPDDSIYLELITTLFDQADGIIAYDDDAPQKGMVTVALTWATTCEDIDDEEPYTLTFKTYDGGCLSDTAYYELEIWVNSHTEGFVEMAPNVFSPNGDDVNDVFKLSANIDPCFDVYAVKIYNRWGNLVFESTDPLFQWDGTDLDGSDLGEGTYFYWIEAQFKNASYSKQSAVTLLK